MSVPSTRALRWTGSTALRSLLLFANFFLILLAYYLVKPASRSLFLQHSDSDYLPYVWTASGLLLLLLVPGYQRLLARYGRMRVVLGSCVGTAALLLVFRMLFHHANAAVAIGLTTEDLISVAAMLVLLMMAMTGRLARAGVYREREVPDAPVKLDEPTLDFGVVLKSIRSSRYVALMALLVLVSQIVEPIVEYQFLHHVEAAYTDGEARTVFLSQFLSLQSGVALAVNLLLTPVIHRYGGVIAGLLMQPLLLGLSSAFYLFHNSLRAATVMKISDRGLSYSVNRASKELLYVGADAQTIFKVKAWIDMVGYRVFKIVGNVAILLIVQWAPYQQSQAALTLVVIGLCCAWLGCVVMLRRVGGSAGKAAGGAVLPQPA